MTSSDTLFATTRLTLGLSQHVTGSTLVSVSKTTNEALDRRKRKRDDESHDTRDCTHSIGILLRIAMILTPGNTPLPRPLTTDPPLLAHRYLPISVAGNGAFSRTILAEDTLSPTRPLVAIKAMKPGFELIGQQVNDPTTLLTEGIQPTKANTEPSNAQARLSSYCSGKRLIQCVVHISYCP
jgi:hypothetical protein